MKLRFKTEEELKAEAIKWKRTFVIFPTSCGKDHCEDPFAHYGECSRLDFIYDIHVFLEFVEVRSYYDGYGWKKQYRTTEEGSKAFLREINKMNTRV